MRRFVSWTPGPLPIPFYHAALSCPARGRLLLLPRAELAKDSVKRTFLEWPAERCDQRGGCRSCQRPSRWRGGGRFISGDYQLEREPGLPSYATKPERQVVSTVTLRACLHAIVMGPGLRILHIRKTPNWVASTGALRAAEIERASTIRVSAGSMMPSSQSRALA